ncbi:MAG: hypothetical protein ABL958_14170 [Bdellovibrionia bacterium]
MIGILKKTLLVAWAMTAISFAMAAESAWVAVESVPARKTAKESAPSVFNIRRDQTYSVMGKTKNGWIKIRSQRDPNRTGFVKASSLKPSSTESTLEGERPLKTSRNAAGLAISYALISQPGRTFKETSPAVEISQLSSTTINFGAFYRFYLSEKWRLRGALSMRTLDFTGTTKPLSGTTTSASSNLKVTQDFFGLGVMAEHLMSRTSWLGLGAEVAQATKSSVTTSSQADQPEKPIYAFIHLTYGLEFSFGKIFLAPELRVLAIPNSTPMMMGGELALMVGFKL